LERVANRTEATVDQQAQRVTGQLFMIGHFIVDLWISRPLLRPHHKRSYAVSCVRSSISPVGPKGFLKIMKNYMSKSIIIAFFVLSSLLLISCAHSEPTSTTNRNATTPTNTAPAASPAATTTTTASADIGVPECDAFLKSYEACVKDKVPAAVRPTFETTMTNWRRAWREQAANPQAKSALVTACKTAQKQSTDAMKAYGCAF
jgi:hypothetical protein